VSQKAATLVGLDRVAQRRSAAGLPRPPNDASPGLRRRVGHGQDDRWPGCTDRSSPCSCRRRAADHRVRQLQYRGVRPLWSVAAAGQRYSLTYDTRLPGPPLRHDAAFGIGLACRSGRPSAAAACRQPVRHGEVRRRSSPAKHPHQSSDADAVSRTARTCRDRSRGRRRSRLDACGVVCAGRVTLRVLFF
jgi:hypothetical protein